MSPKLRFTAGFSLLMAISSLLHAQLPPRKDEPVTITRVEEIHAWLPAELNPKKAGQWTAPQIEVANAALAKKLAERPVVLKMKVELADIFPDGDDLVVFSSLPVKYDHKVRLFAHFPKAANDGLATLKKGQKITVECPLTSATYKKVWNEFCLSIGTKGGFLQK